MNADSEKHTINFINDNRFMVLEIHPMVLQKDTTADTET
jgi:hypothetical protein